MDYGTPRSSTEYLASLWNTKQPLMEYQSSFMEYQDGLEHQEAYMESQEAVWNTNETYGIQRSFVEYMSTFWNANGYQEALTEYHDASMEYREA